MLSLDHISLWDTIVDNKENVIIGLCILKKILALLIKLVLWTQLSFSIASIVEALMLKSLCPAIEDRILRRSFCDSFEDFELSVCHPSLEKSRTSQLVKWMEESQNQWFLALFILTFVTLQNFMPKYLWFQADFLRSQILDITKLKEKKPWLQDWKRGLQIQEPLSQVYYSFQITELPIPGPLFWESWPVLSMRAWRIISHIEV